MDMVAKILDLEAELREQARLIDELRARVSKLPGRFPFGGAPSTPVPARITALPSVLNSSGQAVTLFDLDGITPLGSQAYWAILPSGLTIRFVNLVESRGGTAFFVVGDIVAACPSNNDLLKTFLFLPDLPPECSFWSESDPRGWF